MAKAMKKGGKKVVKKAPKAKKKNASRSASKSKSKRVSLSTSRGVGIRPLSDRVVIRPLSPEELGTTSAFGIIIPDTVKGEKPEQGIVVAVGVGKYENGARITPQVVVGDRVVFSKYGYDEVKVGGVEYYVVSESNLLAVIKV